MALALGSGPKGQKNNKQAPGTLRVNSYLVHVFFVAQAKNEKSCGDELVRAYTCSKSEDDVQY